jgi:DNA-binding MarR family transcriptional regulator
VRTQPVSEADLGAPRSRIPTPGPELDLVTLALHSYLLNSAPASPLVFREPELPTGFPDVVAVFCHAYSAQPQPGRANLGPAHLRLLHHLYTVRHGSASDLASALGHSPRLTRRMLDELEHASLVQRSGSTELARPIDSVFIARRIVAVEAKIHDWRRALRQAVANTWFASHSYVLLPAARISREVCQHAAHLGIGVMTFDGIRVAVRGLATRRQIPASYGSWLVNEWAVREADRHR